MPETNEDLAAWLISHASYLAKKWFGGPSTDYELNVRAPILLREAASRLQAVDAPAGGGREGAIARPFYSDEEARRQIGNLEAAASDWKARAEKAEAENATLRAERDAGLYPLAETNWRHSCQSQMDRADKAEALLSASQASQQPEGSVRQDSWLTAEEGRQEVVVGIIGSVEIDHSWVIPRLSTRSVVKAADAILLAVGAAK